MATKKKKNSLLSTKLNAKILTTAEVDKKLDALAALVGKKSEDRAKKTYVASTETMPELHCVCAGGGKVVVGGRTSGDDTNLQARMLFLDGNNVKQTETMNVNGAYFRSAAYAPDKDVFVTAAYTPNDYLVHVLASTTGQDWEEVYSYKGRHGRFVYDEGFGLFYAVGGVQEEGAGSTGTAILHYSENGRDWSSYELTAAEQAAVNVDFCALSLAVKSDGTHEVTLWTEDNRGVGQSKAWTVFVKKDSVGDLEFSFDVAGVVNVEIPESSITSAAEIDGVKMMFGNDTTVYYIDANKKVVAGPAMSGIGRCATTYDGKVYVGLYSGGVAKITTSNGVPVVEQFTTAEQMDGKIEGLAVYDGYLYAVGRKSDVGKMWKVKLSDNTVAEVSLALYEAGSTGGGSIPESLTNMIAKYAAMTKSAQVATDEDDMDTLVEKYNALVANFNSIVDVFKTSPDPYAESTDGLVKITSAMNESEGTEGQLTGKVGTPMTWLFGGSGFARLFLGGYAKVHLTDALAYDMVATVVDDTTIRLTFDTTGQSIAAGSYPNAYVSFPYNGELLNVHAPITVQPES